MRLNTNNICLYCLHDTRGKTPCPTCRCDNPFNYENPKQYRGGALKPGTILNQVSSPILIGRCLGSGGFGITYLALDVLGKIIVVKEFMPQNVAGRASDKLKITAHKDQEDIYKYGLEKFVDEAKMLAYSRFPEHPNIVTILTLFEENNTAYFTMVYRQGMTLEKYVLEKGSNGITQKELLNIMREVFNGLKAVHNEAIFHRDIKPSNIYIPNEDEHNSKPFLLDFGSARQAMRGSDLAKMSVFLTPGYAPVEQYKKTEKQGAYTDIYACAATMYACMRGNFKRGILNPPPESVDICSKQAKLEPLESVSKQTVSKEFSQAVHLGLQCELHNRPQSVTEFEELLNKHSPSGNYELLGIAGEYDGDTIPLNERPVILGRDSRKCHLVIQNHNRSRVSGEHCQLYMENGRIYLEDFSRHGTTVNENDRHKIKHEITEIKQNDTLNLEGEVAFQIILTEPELLPPKPAEPPYPVTVTHASFLQRFTAWFIDSIAVMVGLFSMLFFESLILNIFGVFFEEGSQLTEIIYTTGGLVILVTLFLVPWIYHAAMESSFKQATLGKMALGISVTDMRGERISFGRASGRYFGKILSSIILMIGFLMPIFTKKKQALHDIMAKCLVISKK